MGKSSKIKSKQSSKQKRAVHLKNVEVYENTISTLDKKLSSLETSRRTREHIEVLKEKLELTLNVEKDFAFINQYRSYKLQLSEVCSYLLFDLIQLKSYAQASIAYDDMEKYPFVEEIQTCIEPFSTLFLVWTEGDNVDTKDSMEKIIERKERLDRITQDSIDIIRTPGARSPLHLLFLHRALAELSRCSNRLFKTVESLSLAMLKNNGEHDYTIRWEALARTFSVYSNIDELRFSKQVTNQSILRMFRERPLHHQLLYGTGYLANSLIGYYLFIYEEEERSLESPSAIADKCIKSLENYIAFISRDTQNKCYTCYEKDTPDQESLVCQECRVVSYCCKYHQRLNYLHHEHTGTRGLGHKQLCPVFKAYRRKMNNVDTSKQGHLERKFQRACKRFLLGTLKNNLQQTRQDSVGNAI